MCRRRRRCRCYSPPNCLWQYSVFQGRHPSFECTSHHHCCFSNRENLSLSTLIDFIRKMTFTSLLAWFLLEKKLSLVVSAHCTVGCSIVITLQRLELFWTLIDVDSLPPSLCRRRRRWCRFFFDFYLPIAESNHRQCRSVQSSPLSCDDNGSLQVETLSPLPAKRERESGLGEKDSRF